MSLVEKLTTVDTQLKNVLNDCNLSLVEKGIDEASNLFEISTKISDIPVGTEYKEINYIRPSWWLPHPQLTQGDNVNEIWILHEIEEDINEYQGINITNATVVREGYKQFWQRIEGNVINQFHPSAVEMIFNCTEIATFSLKCVALNNVLAQFQTTFPNLQIISGTPLKIKYVVNGGSTLQCCSNLRAIFNDIIVDGPMTYSFTATAITKMPNLIYSENLSSISCAGAFACCYNLIDAGTYKGTTSANAFASCVNLQTIHIGLNAATATNTFTNCKKLKYVTIEPGHSKALYLSASTEFTSEILHAIIENLGDLTGATALAFTIGSENLAKIDEEHITMLENKNWNYS